MKKALIIVLFIAVILTGIVFWFFNKEKPETLQKGIVVISPKSGEEVSSPLKITGYVNGDGWIGFEGQVGTVELLDDSERTLAFAILAAKNDWMTSGPIYFEADLQFQQVGASDGLLIFRNENPSGLAENNKEFALPVKIKTFEGETSEIKIYFNNDKMDPEFSCNKVFAVKRIIPETQAVARTALGELLLGPTKQEKASGFFTNINPGVKINSLVIENGAAKVDFDEQLEFQVGGSCRVAAIRAEITQTLKQFPTVKDVIISINGRTEDILQP